MPYGLTSAETRRVTALLSQAQHILASLSCVAGDLPWQYADVQTGISQAVDALIRAFEVLAIHDRTLLPCPQCYRPSVECLCSPIKGGTPMLHETDVHMIRQADIQQCPFSILVPEHYRPDGSCRCDDPAHRAMMIREWDYTEADFAGIPYLRKGGA